MTERKPGIPPLVQKDRIGPFIKGIHGKEPNSTNERHDPVENFTQVNPEEWNPPDIPIT